MGTFFLRALHSALPAWAPLSSNLLFSIVLGPADVFPPSWAFLGLCPSAWKWLFHRSQHHGSSLQTTKIFQTEGPMFPWVNFVSLTKLFTFPNKGEFPHDYGRSFSVTSALLQEHVKIGTLSVFLQNPTPGHAVVPGRYCSANLFLS